MPTEPARRDDASLARGLAGRRVPFTSVPVIDIAPLLDGTNKAAVARKIARAAREVGFFYVRNHGIPDAQTGAVFAAARRFFALAQEAKDALHVAKSYPAQRGYIPFYAENTDPEVTADLKECFDVALEHAPDDPAVRAGLPFFGANVWPEELPDFHAAVYGYYTAVRDLAIRLAGGLALSLALPEDFFADKLDNAIASLRLIHYPPQKGRIKQATLGCGEHSDYGVLTVLAQDDIGGLQLRNADGDWIAAPPVPGTFVVNLGELTELWTNGLYPATLHRVINAGGRDRYSMPFFLDTNYDARIECIETCQDATRPPKFPPVLGGEYLFKRYDETFAFRRHLTDPL